MNRALAFAAVTAALTLAGCGGGGGGGDTPAPAGPTSDVPQSALQDAAGLVAYLNQLISGSTNSTGEPALLGNVTLPVDNTTETSL
jgi:hypothetical protein